VTSQTEFVADTWITPPAAIVFDVGGTLLETVGSPHQVALSAIEATAELDADAFASHVEQVVEEWWQAGGDPAHEDLAATWSEHYARALQRVGYTGDAHAVGARIEAGFLTTGWQVFADSAPTLEALVRRGIRLGVISNWPPTLEATLAGCGILKYFDVVVVSGHVGYAKPNPAIFRAAVEQLAVPAHHIWFVGDSVSHDVAGARGAGLRPILLDRRGRYPDHPDRIETLTVLPDALDRARGLTSARAGRSATSDRAR
jgi:putative hydrolase of the HAD superfamily